MSRYRRSMTPEAWAEIYDNFNVGDIIMVNNPGHEYHKELVCVLHEGVDSDGDVRVRCIQKLSKYKDNDQWFYVHHTKTVIIKRA